MADVITKLRTSQDFHDGMVVFLNHPTKGSEMQTKRSTGHDYSDRINSDSIEAKYTERFDDTSYYSA